MNKFDEVLIENGYYKPIPDVPVFVSFSEGRYTVSFPPVASYYNEYERWKEEGHDVENYNFMGVFNATFSHGHGKRYEKLQWIIPMLAADYFWHNRFEIKGWKEKHLYWSKQAIKFNSKLDLKKHFQIDEVQPSTIKQMDK